MLQRKKLLGGSAELKSKLLSGINKMGDAVGSTLGPKGRTVLIQNDYGDVTATKDGVTVAKNIVLEDNVENMAAIVLREASMKTNDKVGDGTTTATVLAQSIINVGFDKIDKIKNIHLFKKGIEDAAEKVYEYIDENSIELKIKDTELLNNVATISANNDTELGNLLGYAFEQVGEDGVITISEGKTFETTFSLIEGYRFNRGYLSQSFITNQKTKKVEFEGAIIIIIGEKITSADPIFNLIERTKNAMLNSNYQRPYLIICDDIDERVLQLFVINNLRGNGKFAVIKSPGINLDRKDLLLDLAVSVNANILGKEYGRVIEEANSNDFGTAASIEIDKETTTIIDPFLIDSGKERLKNHIENVKHQYEEMDTGFLKDQVKSRIARLSNGIGILYVGGSSDMEIKEKIDRVDDAVHALQAAITDGIVPGGGSLFIKAFKEVKQPQSYGYDYDKGFSTLLESLRSPLKKMLKNAGKEVTAVQHVLSMDYSDPNNGYDILNDNFVDDMISEGIIDPKSVLINALKNAVSITGTFLTTDYAIVNSNYMEE